MSSGAVVEESKVRSNVTQISSMSLEGKEAGRWVRLFTTEGIHPFDQIKWKIVDARIIDVQGNIIFEQRNIEVPSWWDQTTINIIVDKYFRVIDGIRESSVKQMFSRVASILTSWAKEQGYFETEKDSQIFEHELIHVLLHQYGGFNSPVWFNMGVPGRKQTASACFISGVGDSLDDIIGFQNSELNIFKSGSGSGANLSNLRSSYERISAGSFTSGPLAFMKGADAYAGAMKSGGATRNAAKIVVLDIDHPDILEARDGRPGFIKCKAVEEKRAHDLIDAGYDSAYDDPNSAYKSVMYQNANHSVSISDEFMRAVESDDAWHTRERISGKIIHTYKARELWSEIAEAAWFCGDPGLQFSDIINRWHTTPNTGRIRSSNPCFAPETLINTEFGLIRIDDLYYKFGDAKFRTVSALEGPAELHDAIVFPTGIKPVIEIHTKRGRLLRVTPDHKLMTLRGYVEAGAIEIGDQLKLQPGMSPPPNGSSVEADSFIYKLAGWICGDGWLTKIRIKQIYHGKSDDTDPRYDVDRYEVGMCFGKDDKDVLLKIEEYLSKNDIKYTKKCQEGSIGESLDYVRIRTKRVFDVFSRISCKHGVKSHQKRLLDGILRATPNHQLCFLSGLISSDGSVGVQKNGNYYIRISSSSVGLLRDVQLVLQNLGIQSTIYKDRKKHLSAFFQYTTVSGEERVYHSKHNFHDLHISGESLRNLRAMLLDVGMLSDRKAKLLDKIPGKYVLTDVWTDTVTAIIDNEESVEVYDITEFDTHSLIANGVVVSNCGEFLNMDNTACNLCAINLVKFFKDGKFDITAFDHVIRVFVIAQNAIIQKADYPTPAITENSHKLRPIGLNYGNLGALLMRLGYGYDSDEGRAIAARLASLMTGYTYLISAKLAARVGPFAEFNDNSKAMLAVMRMHRVETSNICRRWNLSKDPLNIDTESLQVWNKVIELGEKFGFTVSQATLQAPLGTLSFLMQADTTGIEPAFSLVSYKSLVGGGYEKLVNRSIKSALQNLSYPDGDAGGICDFVERNGYIEGAPGLDPIHLPIFDCASPIGPSQRHLSPMAHIKMLAAIQPLITCAQSKTINLPESTTSREVADLYMESWKLGLKSVTIYRNGSKKSQPLSTKSKKEVEKDESEINIVARRRSMPVDCKGSRHRFEINGHKGYIIMNEYPDGTLGEVFLKLGRSGSTIGSLIDGFTQLLSIALQHGVPLEGLINSFVHTKFEPAGVTLNPNIRFTDSLYDYLFKLLDLKYYDGVNSGINGHYDNDINPSDSGSTSDRPSMRPPVMSLDAPPCAFCGAIMRRNGACYLCDSCGHSSGCS